MLNEWERTMTFSLPCIYMPEPDQCRSDRPDQGNRLSALRPLSGKWNRIDVVRSGGNVVGCVYHCVRGFESSACTIGGQLRGLRCAMDREGN